MQKYAINVERTHKLTQKLHKLMSKRSQKYVIYMRKSHKDMQKLHKIAQNIHRLVLKNHKNMQLM